MISALALFPLLSLVAAQSYPIAESFQGQNFLDGWNFPDAAYDNTTSGDVFWATPKNTSLIYVNDAGRVVLKVDDGFVPYNEKRYAPKLLTKKAYPPGTVWVMDAVHMPYGCSVWPALWTQGPKWPLGGEIDIMEGVNQQQSNQMALHTEGDGCYASKDVTMTGDLTLNNCSITSNSGSGCTVTEKNTASYGEAFAKAGGGVYVTEFAEEYVKIWFIGRADVPSSLTADAKSIDTSTLGTPSAYYPGTSCDLKKFFGDQTLTIDITLCGVWAGGQSVLEATCPALEGDKTCYTTYVINNGTETYKNAYFEINYINIFSNASSTSAGSGQDRSTDTASSASPSNTGGSSSGDKASTTTAKAADATNTNSSAGRTAIYSAGALLAAALALAL